MTSKEIRAKISGLLMEQRKIALAHGGFTAESRQKFDKIQKDVEQLEADVQRRKHSSSATLQGASSAGLPGPVPVPALSFPGMSSVAGSPAHSSSTRCGAASTRWTRSIATS